MSFIGTGYGEVTLRWRAATLSRDATCVFGIDCTGSGTLDPLIIADEIDDMVRAASRLCAPASYSSTWFYRGVRVTVEPGTGPTVGEINVNVAGTLVADPLPPNSAVLVQKRTALGGRRHRGRMYLPAHYFADSAVDSVGTISGASVTALQTKVDFLRTELAAASIPMVILHSVSEILPTLVTSTPVESLIATQRRRLRR